MEISVFGFYGDVAFMVVSLIIMAFYWYFTRPYNYWRDRGVFYIEPDILFGNMKDRILLRQSLHEWTLEMYNKFDGHNYAGAFEGRLPSLMIRDPELIKCVLVKDFEHFVDRPIVNCRVQEYENNMLSRLKGSHWKAVRSLITPTFTSAKIKFMEESMQECGRQIGGYLQQNMSKEGSNEFEMQEFFGRFTLEVIARCAFGVTSNSLVDPDAQFVKAAARINDISVFNRLVLFFVTMYAPKLTRFYTVNICNLEVMAYLTAIIQETLRKRRVKNSERRNDFIQLMLDAAKKENDNNSNILDDGTIISQSLLFILAGYDTSSSQLAFACYELALNPEVQKKLREEIVTVLSRNNNECNYDALQEMIYLEMVLLETLRKYPPFPRFGRICTKEYTLPGTSVVVEKNVQTIIPAMGLHYDPAYYPDPQRFDPERFSAQEKAKRSPYVFLPFGTGPRNCIGMRFAMMSSKIAMIFLLKEYSVQLCAKSVVPFKHVKSSLLLKAQDGLWLDIQRK